LNRKKLNKTILVLILLSAAVNPAFARRVKTVPAVQKNYYIVLRNILTKYISFSQACSFMEGFTANLRVFDRNASQIQEVSKRIGQAISKIEDSRISLSVIQYFIKSILPEFQDGLYIYRNPDVYGEVLNIITDDLKRLDKTASEKPEEIFRKIISENSSSGGDVGAFFAQMFKNLYVNDFNFEQEYSELQRIISGKNYKAHTKLQILREAVERIINHPDEITPASTEIELLITGSLQEDLFIKAYSGRTLFAGWAVC